MILPEELLMKVDSLAGGKHKRSAFVELAIQAYIASEEKKALKNGTAKIPPGKKTAPANTKAAAR